MANENTIKVYQDASSRWVAEIGDDTDGLAGYGRNGEKALGRLLQIIKERKWSFEDQKSLRTPPIPRHRYTAGGKTMVIAQEVSEETV